MSPEELRQRIVAALKTNKHPAAWAVGAFVILIASNSAAYYLTRPSIHDHRQQVHAHHQDVKSLVFRFVNITARCEFVTREQLWHSIELRVGRPFPAMTAEDQLTALDFLLDEIETSQCLKGRTTPTSS